MNDKLRQEYLNPPELCVLEDSTYVRLDRRWNYVDSFQPFSCLYLVEEGSGVLDLNGKEIVMEPGNAYLIPASTRFSYRCDERLNKLFFHFNILGSDGLDLLRNLQQISSCSLREGELAALMEAYNGTGFANSVQFRHRLYDVVSRLLACYPPEMLENKEYSPLVSRAMEYIRSHLSYKLSCTEIAQALFVAEVTLRQKFKRETGCTPRKYIEDLVLFQAELMMKTTSLSMAQISSRLGFCDQFYLSRRFAARYKMSPREYRRREKA